MVVDGGCSMTIDAELLVTSVMRNRSKSDNSRPVEGILSASCHEAQDSVLEIFGGWERMLSRPWTSPGVT